jgi:hypothetical protein
MKKFLSFLLFLCLNLSLAAGLYDYELLEGLGEVGEVNLEEIGVEILEELGDEAEETKGSPRALVYKDRLMPKKRSVYGTLKVFDSFHLDRAVFKEFLLMFDPVSGEEGDIFAMSEACYFFEQLVPCRLVLENSGSVVEEVNMNKLSRGINALRKLSYEDHLSSLIYSTLGFTIIMCCSLDIAIPSIDVCLGIPFSIKIFKTKPHLRPDSCFAPVFIDKSEIKVPVVDSSESLIFSGKLLKKIKIEPGEKFQILFFLSRKTLEGNREALAEVMLAQGIAVEFASRQAVAE